MQARDHPRELRGQRGRDSSRPSARSCRSSAPSRGSAQSGTSWRQRTSGRSAVARRTIASSWLRRSGGYAFPWKTFQLRMSKGTSLRAMRVVIADPPGVHAAVRPRARGRARAGRRRGRARHLPLPLRRRARARGLPRSELFYPLSSRLFRRTRLRLPLKALEHPVGLARLAGDPRRPRPPAVARGTRARRLGSSATPHRSCSPRTTCCRAGRRTKVDLWRRLFGRFERIVVHSERGRDDARRARRRGGEAARDPRIPSCRTDPPRARRRPHRARARPRPAVQAARARRRQAAARAAGARAPLAGDGDAYLPETEIERALGESTVAVFPYRPELDQSGALLQALGAGLPAVVYDVGGLGEVVRDVRRRPRRRRRTTSALSAARSRSCSTTRTRSRRRGPEHDEPAMSSPGTRPRAAHLELYRELT